MSRMGRKPKHTHEQTLALFVRAMKRYGHVPNTREFAEVAQVSTATAWIMMTHLRAFGEARLAGEAAIADVLDRLATEIEHSGG